MTSRFSEAETEAFYDAEDAVYRSFWDDQGSLHWGIFDESTGRDFLTACAHLNDEMLARAAITPADKVLDLGCGNGTTALWLARASGAAVTGIDLSGTRIDNAKAALAAEDAGLQARMAFEKCSATELPFADGSFTRVWSQATIYHIPDKEKTLAEAYRVLAGGGLMVFDDLLKPKPNISSEAREYVYDRLLFDTDFSFQGYQDALRRAGFEVLEAVDLSPHLATSYQCLADITAGKGDDHDGKYRELSYAYGQMVRAVNADELGWGLYVARK